MTVKAPRRKKKPTREELALFPERAPDPLPVPVRVDQTTYFAGWVCARCLRERDVEYRTVMVFFGSDARESAGVNVCTSCAFTIQCCLEKQTRMTPIHAPPEPKLHDDRATPEPERLHPWEV